MNRRGLLALCGATLTAGCSGLFPAGEPEPPAFSVELDGPGRLALGREFSVTATVANDGGSAGTYEDTLVTFPGMVHGDRRAVRVGPVPPGGTRSATLDGLVATYAGRWPARLETAAVSHDVPVTTVPLGVGETLQVRRGHHLTVETVSVRRSYGYDYYDEGRFEREADPGRAFLFATVRVENRASEPRRVPSRAEFSALDPDGRYPVHLTREPWSGIDVPGDPYPPTAELSPGDRLRGWLVFEFPDPGEAGAVGVVWNRDRESSPPETIWQGRAGTGGTGATTTPEPGGAGTPEPTGTTEAAGTAGSTDAKG